MSHHNDKFDDLAGRLVENRPSLEPVDLDRIKLQTLGRGSSSTFSRGGMARKVLAPVLALGLIAGGSAATFAGGDEGDKKPAATCGYKKNGKPQTCKKPPKCKDKPSDPPDCVPKTHKTHK